MGVTCLSTLLTDQNLVEQSKAGNRKAQETLARACLSRVQRMVYLIYGKRSDTEDVIQTVMVTVFKDIKGYQGIGKFTGWLDRLTYNVVHTHFRQLSRWLPVFTGNSQDDVCSDKCDLPERQATRRQLFEYLSSHLDAIGNKKRLAVVMSMFFDHMDSEIAEIVGCSTETAKKRVQHGRRELARRVQKDHSCRELLKEVVSWE